MELKPGMTFVKGEREYEYAGFRKNPDDPTKTQLVARINPGARDEALHMFFDPQEIKDQGKDFWIGTELPYGEFARQYEEQVKILKDVGIITRIPLDTEDDIIGSDAFYPVPTLEDIQKKILENPDVYREKMQQGFTQMLLVPFATDVPTLINAFDRRLKHYAQQNQLFPGVYENSASQDVPLLLPGQTIAATSDLKIGSGAPGTRQDWELIRYNLDPISEHNSTSSLMTKEELLRSPRNKPFEGWQIVFVQDVSDVWSKEKRIHYGAASSYLTDVEEMTKDPMLQHESGFTAEDLITYALFVLEKKHSLIGARMRLLSGGGNTPAIISEVNYLLGNHPGGIPSVTMGRYIEGARKYSFDKLLIQGPQDPAMYVARTAVRVR